MHYPIWKCVRDSKITMFSGERGAKYHKSKSACKRIHTGELASWICTILTKSKNFFYVNNRNGEDFEQNYFIAIRSSHFFLAKVIVLLLSHIAVIDLVTNLGIIKRFSEFLSMKAIWLNNEIITLARRKITRNDNKVILFGILGISFINIKEILTLGENSTSPRCKLALVIRLHTLLELWYSAPSVP